MKRTLLTLGITAVFALSNVSIAGELSLETVTGDAGAAELQEPGAVPAPYPYAYQPPCGYAPFGYPPYAAYGQNPSSFRDRIKQRRSERYFERALRPAFYPADLPPYDASGLAIPAQIPAEAAAAVPAEAATPAVAAVRHIPAPYAVPQPAPYGYPGGGQPVTVYRPSPARNFLSLLHAPRPYIGYDPYAQPRGAVNQGYQGYQNYAGQNYPVYGR
ncbi:MAG: hypothetical protein LBT46_03245 [Planctomycetaceae bacterium]|jgi:hypothetical protein|nr:hypothetical protein [Planctomycetaceae bacterium]